MGILLELDARPSLRRPSSPPFPPFVLPTPRSTIYTFDDPSAIEISSPTPFSFQISPSGRFTGPPMVLFPPHLRP